MTLLPSTFEKTLGETTYQLDARPVYGVLVAATIACALLVALVVAARRRPGAIVSPFLALVSFVLVAAPLFAYATRWLAGVGADDHAAPLVFRDAIMLDALAASVGVGAAFAAVFVVALRNDNQLRLLPYALPCALLGYGTSVAVPHADSIARAGSMPFFAVKGQKDQHVGRERDVPVQLMRTPRRRFWGGMENGPQPFASSCWKGPEKVHVPAARSSGEVPFTAGASCGPVTSKTRLSVRAVPELASPLLSLRVGDRFVYRVSTRSSGGALLYLITLSGNTDVSEVDVEVVGTRVRDGFRTFVVEVHRGESTRQVEVVAISGETRFYDAEQGIVGQPVVAFAAEENGLDPIPCSFELLDAKVARCQRGGRSTDVPAPPAPGLEKGLARPPIAFEGAAPAAFELYTSDGAGLFAKVFVAVITVGLVIPPGGSSSSSYTLVSTRRGPVGAPEAPPG